MSATEPDLGGTAWRRSRLSMANGNCVEAAQDQDGVSVRDSSDRAGTVLRYSAGAWKNFIIDAKAGKFDRTQAAS
jgi:hypothetical protein